VQLLNLQCGKRTKHEDFYSCVHMLLYFKEAVKDHQLRETAGNILIKSSLFHPLQSLCGKYRYHILDVGATDRMFALFSCKAGLYNFSSSEQHTRG